MRTLHWHCTISHANLRILCLCSFSFSCCCQCYLHSSLPTSFLLTSSKPQHNYPYHPTSFIKNSTILPFSFPPFLSLLWIWLVLLPTFLDTASQTKPQKLFQRLISNNVSSLSTFLGLLPHSLTHSLNLHPSLFYLFFYLPFFSLLFLSTCLASLVVVWNLAGKSTLSFLNHLIWYVCVFVM